MTKEITVNGSNGINAFGLLGVVFVTLKLCGVIDWSWWYVTMPFWIGFAIVFSMFVFGAVFITASHYWPWPKNKK